MAPSRRWYRSPKRFSAPSSFLSEVFFCSYLPLGLPMVSSRRRRRGYLTVKRVKGPWLSNTAAVMHYLRVVKPRSSQ